MDTCVDNFTFHRFKSGFGSLVQFMYNNTCKYKFCFENVYPVLCITQYNTVVMLGVTYIKYWLELSLDPFVINYLYISECSKSLRPFSCLLRPFSCL